MESMRSKANRRSLRTLVQFILGGSFTGLVAVLAQGLSTRATAIILAVGTLVVTWVQNYAEDHKIIRTVFPSPPKTKSDMRG